MANRSLARRPARPRRTPEQQQAQALRTFNPATDVSRISIAEDGSVTVPDRALESAWERRSYRLQGSRDRILECADVRHARVAVAAPDAVETKYGDESEWWAARDPERLTLESRVVQTYADNGIDLERAPLGTTNQAIEDADDFALWINTVVANYVPKRSIWGKAVEDAEWGMVVEPKTLVYDHVPDPYDLLSEEDWAQIDENERDDWEPTTNSVAGDDGLVTKQPARRRFKREYWRDAKDRAPDHALYKFQSAPTFKRDETKTSAAHGKAYLEHLCSDFPVAVRLISALDCIPYLVEGTGRDRFECRGLLIRKLYEYDDLVDNYRYQWSDMDQMALPIGYDANNTTGANGMAYVYEAWVWVRNQATGFMDPCVIRSVAGRSTWQAGDESRAPVLINLREKYGLDILPIWYGYGTHTESDDPDLRGVPLLWPVTQVIINREGLKTSLLAHINKYAFGKLAVIPDPRIPASSYMEGDTLRDFNDAEGDLVTLPGPVMPLVQPPVLAGVRDLHEMFTIDVQSNMPDPSSAGQGAGDRSGHSLTVTKSFVLAAASDTMDGVARCVEWTGETIAHVADCLSRKFKIQIPVWVEDELPVSDADQTQLVALELNERWLKSNYRLTAVYEKLGNIAEVEQEASLYQRQLATFEDVVRKRGKKSPNTEWVKVMADQVRMSPEGRLAALADVLRRRGKRDEADKIELQLNGILTQAGLPVDALAPEVAPGSVPGGMPAVPGAGPGTSPGNTGPTALPNTAQAVRGSVIQGEVGAASRMNDAQAIVGQGLPASAVA